MATASPTIWTPDTEVGLVSICRWRARGEGHGQKRRPDILMGTDLVCGCAMSLHMWGDAPRGWQKPPGGRALQWAAECFPGAEGLSSQHPGLTTHLATRLTLPYEPGCSRLTTKLRHQTPEA